MHLHTGRDGELPSAAPAASPPRPTLPVAQSGEPAAAVAPLPSLQRDSQLPGKLTTCRVARSPGPVLPLQTLLHTAAAARQVAEAPQPCSGPRPLQKLPGSPGPQDASRAHPALRPRLLALLTSEGQPVLPPADRRGAQPSLL